MSIAKLLENVLGSKVKKLSKLTDVGLDVAKGVIDASKGAIRRAAINEIKSRATLMASEWIKREYGIELGKNGINAAELTRLANAAIAPVVLSDITNIRSMRKEIVDFAIKKTLEEYGYSSPSVLLDNLVVKARAKIGEDINNMGQIVDKFEPDSEALEVLALYGVKKPPMISQLDAKTAAGNRERQAKFRNSKS